MKHLLWSRKIGHSCRIPMVLIPGASSTAFDWPRTFIDTLTNGNHPLFLIDHRDCGRNLWDVSEYTLEDMADDVLMLMLSNRIKTAHLIGASMGGCIAQLIALQEPDKVASLSLLMSTSGRGIWDASVTPPTTRIFAAIDKEYQLHSSGRHEEALMHRYESMAFPEKLPYGEARRRARCVINHGFNPRSRHIDAFKASKTRTGRLSQIIAPTLIIHGNNDELFDTRHAHLMHETISGSKLLLIDRMAHYISENNGPHIARKILHNCKTL